MCSLQIVYLCKFSSCRAINYGTHDWHGYYHSSTTNTMLARHYRDLCLMAVVGYIKCQNLQMHPRNVWVKLHHGSVWFFFQASCVCFISILIVNWMLQWILEFNSVSHYFLFYFIKHLHEHGHIKNVHEERANLSGWKSEHNKGHGVLKVRHTKIAKELGICVRKVTDKVFGCSDRNENVSRFSFT